MHTIKKHIPIRSDSPNNVSEIYEQQTRKTPRRNVLRERAAFRCALVLLCLIGSALLGDITWPVASETATKQPILPPLQPNHSLSGEKLARSICSACHIFPEPQLLDKKTWREKVLPRMETRLGVSPPDYTSSAEGELIKTLGIYPNEPLIQKSDWDSIVDYYLKSAPEKPLPQQPRPEIQVGLRHFSVIPGRFRNSPPLTTMVQANSDGNILMGDDKAKTLALLDASGRFQHAISVDNVPISVVEATNGIYVTAIGSFQPSEMRRAQLLFYERTGHKIGDKKVILNNLPRAVHTEFADYNGDGRIDFAMCMFGNLTGRFSWFENVGEDQYKEHILIEKPGAIRCDARDLDGNGSKDLVVLMAQETEALYLFYNDGKGEFSNQLVFQTPPVYGHNHFELADFNDDGQVDLLVANGDNGEYESPLKNYHGIRIYLNRGPKKFEPAYFFPLNGATKAMARDFDDDGDLDIAAISFFPDYVNAPRESFILLENKGSLNFTPATFSECISGRWVAMDVADLEKDGDWDIILGSYIRGPTAVPAFLAKIWETNGPSVLILKNRLKDKRP